MKLETKRLLLRDYILDDVDALARIFMDAPTMCFWPRPLTREDALGWIERSLASYTEHQFGRWPLILKENNQIIGDCGIIHTSIIGREINDLGWILHRDYWHRGYATEAAEAVRDYAFDTLKLDSLHANMAWDHIASQAVAERIGMHKIAEFENPKNLNKRTFLYEIRKG